MGNDNIVSIFSLYLLILFSMTMYKIILVIRAYIITSAKIFFRNWYPSHKFQRPESSFFSSWKSWLPSPMDTIKTVTPLQHLDLQVINWKMPIYLLLRFLTFWLIWFMNKLCSEYSFKIFSRISVPPKTEALLSMPPFLYYKFFIKGFYWMIKPSY